MWLFTGFYLSMWLGLVVLWWAGVFGLLLSLAFDSTLLCWCGLVVGSMLASFSFRVRVLLFAYLIAACLPCD